MDILTLPRPDDWHVHLREGAALRTTVPHTARCFGRAIVMPNLRRPVTTTAAALAYREAILAALPEGMRFEPMMTLYLTDDTPVAEIRQAHASGRVLAVKLYPAGATTHSDAGVTRLERVYPVLEAMQEIDLPLLLHGEVTLPHVDIFDRERFFIDTQLAPLVERFPRLRMVLEHITTREAVDYVRAAPATVAATLTAHHLLLNRNAMLAGGIRPHHYCLPVLKREAHRLALVEAATSGEPKFFLGTDSAPHPLAAKESACGCAGIYTAPAALELYAEVFEAAGCLERLEGFAARHGASFYRLPPNAETITLSKQPWTLPERFDLGSDTVVPLRAGATIPWRAGPSPYPNA